MEFSRWKNFFVVMIMLEIFLAGSSFSMQNNNIENIAQTASIINGQKITATTEEQKQKIIIPKEIPPEKLSNPPETIKAVYVTGWSAGTKSYLNYLTNLFKTTEINAVVIDIKDYSGIVSYPSMIPNINALVNFFHNQNIYVIGRIAIFEDPAFSKARPDLAVYNKFKTEYKAKPARPEDIRLSSVEAPSRRVLWLDNHKLSWLDPASKEVWDYNVSIAKDVLLRGFDEINFDYIRFPSDGKTQNMGFPYWDEKTPMHIVLKNFFKYLRQELPDAKLSADLFGQTTVNSDDLGIGQIIEDSLEYFDYVSPMVYPSHYINGFMDFSNPAEHPYEVIKYSMDTALAKKTAYLNSKILPETATPIKLAKMPIKLAKLRPWLQDFNMGAIYTTEMVKLEIAASKDALKNEYNGYMLWNPSNVYTKGAILKPN